MNTRALNRYNLPNFKEILKGNLFKERTVTSQAVTIDPDPEKKIPDTIQILETKIMRGPNYWSNYRKKLIVAKIDIGELENYPSNKIPGFTDRLMELIPTLIEHRCSEEHKGGFLKRLQHGTWMGHILEHVALELQCLGGMDCGFGRTRSAGAKGIYYVIFDYEIEQAGIYALEASIDLIRSVISNQPFNPQECIQRLKALNAKYNLGPSTKSIVDEAVKKQIPYHRVNEGSTVIFGQGIHQKKICASIAATTSNLGVETACDKEETKELLSKAHIPVPKGVIIYDKKELSGIIEKLGFPVVIKPVDGNHGRGVTTNIMTYKSASAAFDAARKISKGVIVETYVDGYDYRFLVINYKLVAVARRTPATIKGDGLSTISELIEDVNLDPNRGDGHECVMTKIKVDEITKKILAERKYKLNTVLPCGEILQLKDTANLSTGGTATDVTDHVHPYNYFLAERIARIMGLDICGIDVVAKDIDKAITPDVGAIIEVNACPGFRMHLSPSKGTSRNVGKNVIDMLYPQGSKCRIPVVAVTGTNGKTTTTRLIAHLAKHAGRNVGYTTTDGIYVDNYLIHEGDCTGPQSAKTILTDPSVDFAVLECARGGILRSGLGFDNCNISVITNISEDHLGLGGINSLKEMAKVKSVVAKSTFEDGYAILNADDELVMSIQEDLDCKIALFSMDANNPAIQKKYKEGGMVAFLENGYIVVAKDNIKLKVEKVENIPLTISGRAECMIKNIFPAALVCMIEDFPLQSLKSALASFIPSPETTPGRFNIFQLNDVQVMVDYAHNVGGFEELKKFMDKTSASFKIGVMSGTGDRREEDLVNAGRYAAQMFDRIIIKNDRDLRGNTAEKINGLLTRGIQQIHPGKEIICMPNEVNAVALAIKHAPKNSFIVVLADDVKEVLSFLKKAQKKSVHESQPMAAITYTRELSPEINSTPL
jgi:cyanophycin synthetase